MPADYVHNHGDFAALIRIVAEQRGVDPALVEKDYWIMHCLHGLQRLGLTFQLKGGTSLSKGHKVIERFSEDIDILIEPPPGRGVKTGHNQDKPAHIESRRTFYDWLANEKIRIDGITSVERAKEFDNNKLFSAGIRLRYPTKVPALEGLREGVVLEAGFDTVAPNEPKDISSWVYDHAVAQGVPIIDNRAKGVPCYDPRYTFVEKLQTISTKFRQQQVSKESPIDFMRHYYDAYNLLRRNDVQDFIGTEAYKAHKKKRFRPGDNPNITQNQAFILADPATRELYAKAYAESSSLYFGKKPTFDETLAEFGKWATRL
jgi:Nucleotidyl transferase AbiEii toxin, Type IV TA system